jgi:hypothetical protein
VNWRRHAQHPVVRWLAHSRETGWSFAVAGTLVYVAYLIAGHAHHEMWRDEVHSWTLARQADGFWDLVTGDRVYEGHPPGWFWYLRVWTFLTRRPWGLHAATIAAMGTAALLFLRHAPFPRLLKLALLGSYLIGFEYGVMSRNYTLTWLLLVVFCSVLQPLRPRFVSLATVLGMMALTSVFGMFIACALAVMMLPLGVHLDRSDRTPSSITFRANPRFLLGAAGFIVVLAFFAWSTAPPDPNYNTPGWQPERLNLEGVAYAFRRLTHAFLPMRPNVSPQFWTTFDHVWRFVPTLALVVGIGLFGASVAALRSGRFETAGLVFGYLTMSTFILVRYGAEMRHLGHFVLLFIAATWVHRLKAPRENHTLSTALLLLCAGFQIQSFGAAAYADWRYVFSGGREMAAWIEDARLQDVPIVAGPDALILTVTSYLDRPFISAQTEEINATQVFHSRRRPFTTVGLVERAVTEVQAKHKPVLVLSDEPLPAPAVAGLQFNLLKQTPGYLGEGFFLYRLEE